MISKGYVVVKVSAPMADLDKIQQYYAVVSGGEISSILGLFETQIFQLAATFGPNCKSEILSTGVEEALTA